MHLEEALELCAEDVLLLNDRELPPLERGERNALDRLEHMLSELVHCLYVQHLKGSFLDRCGAETTNTPVQTKGPPDAPSLPPKRRARVSHFSLQ